MEVIDIMNGQEMKRVAIEKYVNIQRIKKHEQEEIEGVFKDEVRMNDKYYDIIFMSVLKDDFR